MTTDLPDSRYHYLAGPDDLGGATCEGPLRWIKPVSGAPGGGGGGGVGDNSGGGVLQALSVDTQIRLPHHTLNENAGSMSFWLMSLEDLRTAPLVQHIAESEPGHKDYTLFADQPGHSPWKDAAFAWVWSAGWYPQWFAKFYKGNVYGNAYNPTFKAIVAAGHHGLDRLRWYHCALTWNRDQSRYRLYSNGVLTAAENQHQRLAHEPAGPELYCGNPTIGLRDVRFYDVELTADQVASDYATQPQRQDAALTKQLRQTFAGAALDAAPLDRGEGWTSALRLPLTEPADLEQLYVQGATDAVEMTPEGLSITTQDRPLNWKPEAPGEDPHQLYLWTRQQFEGDLEVRLRFMPRNHNGLLLFIAQASGMQGEDFMADYPLRTTGAMKTVYADNVRNYHWEFFREMDDARNDVASHVLVKNPWLRPVAYRCMDAPLQLDTWHKLRFLQIGARLQGWIDDQLIFNFTDDPDAHSGPVYRLGHVAVRSMIKTSALLADLEVDVRLADVAVVNESVRDQA